MIAFVFTIKKNPIFFYFERISLMYGLMISFIVFFLSSERSIGIYSGISPIGVISMEYSPSFLLIIFNDKE